MKDISPLDLLHRALRFWWVVAACAITGGSIGLLVASLHAPLYEAAAVYRVAFDQARAPEAGFREIEAAKQAALDIFTSDLVRSQVAREAQEAGIAFSQADFSNGRLTVQRINNRWLLAVRNESPEGAAVLSDAWSRAALPPLEEAYNHALAVESLQQQLVTLNSCAPLPDLASANACAGTDFPDRAGFQSALAALNAALSTEQQAAEGLVAALTLDPARPAEVPTKPVFYGRNVLVLAGLFGGFLLGAGLTLVLPLSRGRDE